MPTTTNYGWTTPADTDLVKDGASAIRTLGTAIDTTVFNNAGAAIAKTIVDAKGDIIAATAADTVARLAVGTNGQLLAANSSTSTGLEWTTVASGGMTLLSTTTLSTNSVTISSISGSYKNLYVIGRNISSSANDNVQIRYNSDTGSNYAWSRVRATGSTLTGANATGNTNMDLFEVFTSNAWNQQSFFELLIPRYSESEIKAMYLRSLGSGSSARKVDWLNGSFNSSSAISSLTIFCETPATTFSTGTVYVYGVS